MAIPSPFSRIRRASRSERTRRDFPKKNAEDLRHSRAQASGAVRSRTALFRKRRILRGRALQSGIAGPIEGQMLWFFEREDARLHYEVRRRTDGDEFELVITA